MQTTFSNDVVQAIMEDMVALSREPNQPLMGKGFARVYFPIGTDVGRLNRHKVWTSIPDKHKCEVDAARYISPEAFNIIQKHL